MRCKFNRWLSTTKLAALVGVAALAALGVALLTAPAHSAQTYQVGHDLPSTEQHIIAFRVGCRNLDALTGLIEATHSGDDHFFEVLNALLSTDMCFKGKMYQGVFEAVVAVMAWGDTGNVVLMEVHHPNTGDVAFTWFTEDVWDKQKIRLMGQGT